MLHLQAPLGSPVAPSGVAIDEHGSVEVRGRTIRSKAMGAIDLLSHLLVPCRSHCANLKVEIPTTKTAIHPWITEMLNKGYGKFPPPSKKAAE